jgi:hypothetical protein
MRWAGHVAHMGEKRKVYKVLVGKPEGKRPLGRPRRRWEDGIIMDLREIRLGGVDWIRLAQDRDRWRAVVSTVMNLRVLAPRSYITPVTLLYYFIYPHIYFQVNVHQNILKYYSNRVRNLKVLQQV